MTHDEFPGFIASSPYASEFISADTFDALEIEDRVLFNITFEFAE